MLLTIILVIYIADDLDIYLSVMGCIFGMTNVLLLPSLCHLVLVAETTYQKWFDYFIILCALVLLFLVPTTTIMQYMDENSESGIVLPGV